MTLWANSGARDLHLELRHAIVPGARGARDALVEALRATIRSGRLAPAAMLPPSRSLATDLGLARNTVAEAYAELVAEGWLASRQGAGTWVVNSRGNPLPPRPRGVTGIPTHNLMPGSPDVSQFPRNAWLASTKRALATAPNEALRMGDPLGRIELRVALTEYLGRVRGVRTSPDDIVICAGTRHAVEILARVLGGPDKPIAVEAYGLHLFREALAAQGVRTVPVNVDDDGAVITGLEGTEAAAALLTPAHHFPHGVPLHPGRRKAVLDWAHRTDGYLLEDDYDGEFRYDRQPIGSVQGLDPDRVVYLGSASKSLSPVLRLGWMVLPAVLVDKVVAALGGQQFYVNALAQLTMADFIANGAYDKHIRRMRATYRRRRDLLAQALQPYDVGVRGLSAGLHLQLTLPEGTEAEVMRRAGEAGIALSGLRLLRHPDAGPDIPGADGVVVSFGTPADHAFGAAVDALCRVLDGLSR
ncbi:PLP-dependent aminotransferase family protein [Mycolicibacterium frederiksbergense]|uniref:MocR-like pyridoxine biosynthesis transcription factor PdxR n=1 Tax=Mycolicibacterium frederiksbergense TaxID=117567 RepID=UPI00265C2B32|nr:PLP-dependent aminotransferase family protein [Mycolicibacterium frederiksbergense]MDO0974209.1 PLP-dependent aminotransferase family protein [Mycolicibacterium frederiksbergense]